MLIKKKTQQRAFPERLCRYAAVAYSVRLLAFLTYSSFKTKKHSQGVLFVLEAPPGIGPGNKGFADLCLTAWLWRRIVERITGLATPAPQATRPRRRKTLHRSLLLPFAPRTPSFSSPRRSFALLERITGLEPATSTLARSRSTK